MDLPRFWDMGVLTEPFAALPGFQDAQQEEAAQQSSSPDAAPAAELDARLQLAGTR